MANIIVDGFATYGVGNNTDSLRGALLAGAYAEIVGSSTQLQVAQGLPWDLTETSFWVSASKTIADNALTALRRVLPAAANVGIYSLQMAVSSLPGINDILGPIDFRNGSNQVVAKLYLQSTGAITLDTGTQRFTTAGPVIVAEKVHHLELKFSTSGNTFVLKVDEVTVLNASGLTYTNAGPVAQYALLIMNSTGGVSRTMYIGHFIARDTTGAFNNDFVGNRFVATLYPAADDPTAQGWTPQPISRFGIGVLDLTDEFNIFGPSTRAAVTGPNTVATDIGNQDFTIEGNFRLRLPISGSNLGAMFGKWDESNNNRSYQLYLGGPTLDNGNLVFRTSTDGLNGTVINKLRWPWNPETGVWYHIAVARESGVLRLFIDGIQAGIDVADSETYFAAGNTFPILGAQATGGIFSIETILATGWGGWQDEFRLTIGTCRYTGDFAPPTGDFPRGAIDDPDWLDVAWLSGWNNAAVADDGPLGLALTQRRGANFLDPDDGNGAYQTIREHDPNDDNFIEAALVPASNILTLTTVAGNLETVTVGTTNGVTPAVYTFKTVLAVAFDVLRGATAADSIANLIAAINKASGEGVTYGTGTTANADVQAIALPVTSQLEVEALTPGAVGNAIASTETLTNGSWQHAATLDGGLDIPGPSRFYFDRLPPGATIVDSVTFVGRQYKTDSGAATTQITFTGVDGGEEAGGVKTLGTSPNLTFDTFEDDPDNPGDPLTPQVIRTMRAKINRVS